MNLGGLAGPDLVWLAVAAFVAGLVRGFSGFGTAMVYLPVAGQILSPFGAITTLIIMDLVAPLPLVWRAIGQAYQPDLLRLLAGLFVALPFGLYALTRADPELFRYAVSGIALVMLAALLSGLRYRGEVTPPAVFATGAVSGLLMGVAGLPGPPVILFYMARPIPAAAIRATTLCYLYATDIVMLPMLAAFGRLEMPAILAGALLIVPYFAGNVAGARAFRPERERGYRTVAYAVIGLSALSGLPLWD